MPASTLERGQVGRRASRRPRASSPPTARCSTARASRSSPTARRRSLLTTGARALRPARPTRGRRRRRPTTRSCIDKATADEYDFKRRRHGHGRRAPRRRSSTRSPASRTLGDSRQPRRLAAWSLVTLPEAPAGDRPRRLRRDLGRRRERHDARGAQGRDRRRAGPRLRRPHRQGAGRAAGAGPLGRARLHPHGAARVRGRRAARRRLPDLQHVHGHRRAAHDASSRCCACSAPRARQILRSVLAETFVIGLRRVDRRHRSSASSSRRPWRALLERVRDRPRHDRARCCSRARSSSACSSA